VRVDAPHLARLAARARPAGSPAAREARNYCADVLKRAGFQALEERFEYSAFPGNWATPIAGVVAGLAAIAFFLGRHIPNVLIVAIVGLLAALLVLARMGRRGVLDLSLMRRRGANLTAVRGRVTPAVWLVAHIDSKWQPISMITRVVGVVGTSLGLIASLVLAFMPDRTSDMLAAVVLMGTWLATVPLMLSVVGDRNHGALDNASGVAAVLAAAELLPKDANVGVLITDGEELGLAGARAWARSRRRPAIALNCDSVDDTGRVTAMYSGTPPAAVLSALEASAFEHSEPLRVMRLIPGILTDSVALADAGWQTVTLSRGEFRTLQRIHTSRDTLATMRGRGIGAVAAILARTATELC
jgi:hypothetical protein